MALTDTKIKNTKPHVNYEMRNGQRLRKETHELYLRLFTKSPATAAALHNLADHSALF
jgi:hypothetical protein